MYRCACLHLVWADIVRRTFTRNGNHNALLCSRFQKWGDIIVNSFAVVEFLHLELLLDWRTCCRITWVSNIETLITEDQIVTRTTLTNSHNYPAQDKCYPRNDSFLFLGFDPCRTVKLTDSNQYRFGSANLLKSLRPSLVSTTAVQHCSLRRTPVQNDDDIVHAWDMMRLVGSSSFRW